MKLTILGCSGSVPTADNPASGYVVSFDNAPSIILDMGSGTLGQLAQLQDPCDAHVAFSHLHADHCLDFPSLPRRPRAISASARPPPRRT